MLRGVRQGRTGSIAHHVSHITYPATAPRSAADPAPAARAALDDFVAQHGGFLELQILRGSLHLLLQILDQPHRLVPRQNGRRRVVLRLAFGHGETAGVRGEGAPRSAITRWVRSRTDLMMDCGTMPCAVLCASCLARRRLVSSIARRIESVMTSAYMIALPLMWRAARPTVWISACAERRNPPCPRPGSRPGSPPAGPAPRAAG